MTNFLNTTDPNRPGMHTKLIKFLLKLRSPRIVYVSCNPSTCARDLDYLCHGVVCTTFSLFLQLKYENSHVCFKVRHNLNSDGKKFRRLLQVDTHTTSRHVPAHSPYWMCMLAGALLNVEWCLIIERYYTSFVFIV